MRHSNHRTQSNANSEANAQEAELHAEQSVLGAMLTLSCLDNPPCSLNDLLLSVEDRYFYYRQHRVIYQAIRFLAKKETPVDMLTTSDVLEHHQQLDEVGGYAYLADLCKELPTVANVNAYVAIIKEAADRRAFNAILQNHLTDQSDNVIVDVGDTLSELDSIRDKLLDQRTGLRPFGELAEDWLDAFETRFNGLGEEAVRTGIDNIDELLAPVYIPTGSLVVIGSRPKMGKTQFILNLAEYIGLELNKAIASFTLEMTHEQLIERMIGMRACVSHDLFYQTQQDLDQQSQDELAEYDARFVRVTAAIREYTEADYFISDDANSSIERIELECRMLSKHKKLGAILVDYLTLMPKGDAERHDLAYAEITRRLKQLAKELNCIVFLVSQLNRSLEMRQDKRPLPSDSRDTGQIEQDCDLWIGLYRDAFYYSDSDYPDDVIEVLIRLNRHGDTGTALCCMNNGRLTNYTGPPIQHSKRPFKSAYGRNQSKR
ncbi:replicative DNA helicase [Vibrio jasicida]|uniref:replicative DNA helicase n=1 Tax=Vibrio jasicida TaxID=766224 RepID=UPI000695A4BC|nr:DnaB-like helicase C-terminal domain-containing protein [Vibrio jasicida]